MSEEEAIFKSKIKSTGIFSFKDFYKFCHDWLVSETNLHVAEGKYTEKLSGDTKDVEVEWEGRRDVTDYFRFKVNVKFVILKLSEVEISQNGVKEKTNKGSVEVEVKGILVRDYKGKFERTSIQKFLRSIYEKWIISARVKQLEDKLVEDLDEFLAQAKAFLDLEGKK
ncbi:MAG: hypothetical protein KKA64_03870 [Nanoarchaeota archaeon]|nr:hypothetical protein [Nanoarchaeota archaeon]